MSPRMRSSCSMLLAALVLTALAACATAPAYTDLTPPPRRPVDAKTQLEYGNPPPGRY